MNFLPEAIDQYCQRHTSKPSELLEELDRETHLKVLMPRMLAGSYQGRLLSMFSKMIRPKYVLEIGTYTGYSALCFSEGLQSEGQIFTIDKNEELHTRTRSYIEKAGKQDQIQLIVGEALQEIPKLDYKWDLVFIDADKENYSNYYDLVFERLNVGGYIIADNVLWSGKVLDKDALEKDIDTKALDIFNKKVHADSRVENVLLGVRDGLMVIRKIKA